MERIATPDRAVDLFGAGKDGFTDGLPPGSISTSLEAKWWNAVQEELASFIEAEDIVLVPGTFTQLREAVQKARKNTRLADVVFNTHRATRTEADIVAVACASAPPVKTVDFFTTRRGVIAVVGTNIFLISDDYGATFSSFGAVVAVLNDVACRAGNTELGDCMAVGDAGKYFYDSPANGDDSGTISGNPDLDYVFWDETNDLWWAVGPGGIYKTADVTISWSQVSSVAHKGGAFIPSTGRVLFFRPSDSKIYFTDDTSTLVAGADLAGTTTTLANMEFDTDANEVIISFASGYKSVTDGTAVGTVVALFSSEPRLFLLGGRLFGTGSENAVMRITRALSAIATDYRSGQMSLDGITAVGGCPEFFVWWAVGKLYFSFIIPDLNGG